jgi:hypothetical protein
MNMRMGTNVPMPMQIDGAEVAERKVQMKLFVILSVLRPAFGVVTGGWAHRRS